MYGLLLVALAGALAVWRQQPIVESGSQLPMSLSGKLDRLWEVAQESLQDRKYLRAEKALLTILRIDERNATAYNRLGILYAKQKAFDDAIECFEIAQSLEPGASSLHNVGLIYYETKRYDKAALAFEQALSMEDKLAARHIAYAKVQEKLGHDKKMIESLERATTLEPSAQTYQLLLEAYERTGNKKKAAQTRTKLQSQLHESKPRQGHTALGAHTANQTLSERQKPQLQSANSTAVKPQSLVRPSLSSHRQAVSATRPTQAQALASTSQQSSRQPLRHPVSVSARPTVSTIQNTQRPATRQAAPAIVTNIARSDATYVLPQSPRLTEARGDYPRSNRRVVR